MNEIRWGIIGCGDVTEVKSGPAFNKVPGSRLVSVMRRNKEKLEDYAKRHGVPKWTTNANLLISDEEINALYIATPPLQHEEYTLAALQAGKFVYVEKPMALNAGAAERMRSAVGPGQKLVVAHYRRAQPVFLKIKKLIKDGAVGKIRFIDMKYLQPQISPDDLQNPSRQWRFDPAIAGGGLFHDLAPHQIDLALYFFGKARSATGLSGRQQDLYAADDIVSGSILFENGVIFNGLWCFTAPDTEKKDHCIIVGENGTIEFSIFGEPTISLTIQGSNSVIKFEKLQHVQQPMIAQVVQYFLDESDNPCSAEQGLEVMKIMEAFTGGTYS